MTNNVIPRVDRLLVEHGRVIVVLLVVVGLLGLGYGAWTYAQPSTETETVTTDVQTVRTHVDTSAVTTGETVLFEEGTRIENAPVYLRRATPTVNLTVTTVTPADRQATVSQRLSVAYQGLDGETVFYESERPLVEETIRTGAGQATSTVELNVSNVEAIATSVQREIGGAGRVRMVLRLTVDYQTETYSGVLTATGVLKISPDAYKLDRLRAERLHSTTTTREVPTEPDPIHTYLPGAVGLSLLAVAGSLERRRRSLVPTQVYTRLHHSRYDEWISEGRLPTDISGPVVRIGSIEDLVNLAIDSDRRVIHDPARELYAVIDEGVLYYYSDAHPLSVQDVFDVDARVSGEGPPPRELDDGPSREA